MPITPKDSTQIYEKDCGKGQAVVFNHGWPIGANAGEDQMLFLRVYSRAEISQFFPSGRRPLPLKSPSTAVCKREGQSLSPTENRRPPAHLCLCCSGDMKVR